MNFSRQMDELARMPEAKERIAKLQNILVRSTQFRNALAKMEECMELTQLSAVPRCMMLTGSTGLGKTTIIETLVRAYRSVEHADVTEVPVFSAFVPKPATIGGLMTQLLVGLGAPKPESGTHATKLTKLHTLLKACRVKLIVLDEFQHLTEGMTSQKTQEVSDWVKTLINGTGVPMVLAGMPTALSVVNCNPQLARRFPIKVQLQPFTWHNDQDELIKILNSIDKQLPFTQPSALAEKDMPLRLMAASDGNLGELMQLLNEAARFAIFDTASCIGKSHFIEAYNAVGRDVHMNPFQADVRELEKIVANQPERAA